MMCRIIICAVLVVAFFTVGCQHEEPIAPQALSDEFAVLYTEDDDDDFDDDDLEGPISSITDLTAPPIDPGQFEVVDGVLQVRNQILEGPISGDWHGTALVIFNADIVDQAANIGIGFGTSTFQITAVRGQPVNGTFEVEYEGDLNGPFFTAALSGTGTGDFEETVLSGIVSDAPPAIDGFFAFEGFIAEDEDDEDDDDDDEEEGDDDD